MHSTFAIFEIVNLIQNLVVGDKDLEELKIEKEESEKLFRDEHCRAANLIAEKGKYVLASLRCHLSCIQT